jgi:aspartate-semialdehyde dehydrogenase
VTQRQHNSKDSKIKVAVLGATGLVGQVFVHLLAQHELFHLALVTGSKTRNGKGYAREVHWALPFPLPTAALHLTLEALEVPRLKEAGVAIVFSALPAKVAKTVEPELRNSGFYVFSNASAMRCEPDVPILVPEVNRDALANIEDQGYPQQGFIVTNANCSTTGLALALAPLKPFGIKEVVVSTYQSVSGAGYPGLPALDIMGDAIPFIPNEEEKMAVELEKILELDAQIYPFCIRIPVPFGHLETVWLTFETETDTEDVLAAWRDFRFGATPGPSFPRCPVEYIDREGFPRPGISFWGSPPGMQVFTGRLKRVNNRIGFTLLVNNLVRGAAGGSIQNAELFLDTYGIRRNS